MLRLAPHMKQDFRPEDIATTLRWLVSVDLAALVLLALLSAVALAARWAPSALVARLQRPFVATGARLPPRLHAVARTACAVLIGLAIAGANFGVSVSGQRSST